ncbi:prepilin-type N-terminal cleavage/methylation domain-containing protein [Candidatus Parcubacteria bacterium]|nr:prepilin-type N-terminal cleavage/methylation domain-containing protein [Candidatus Parcubacteria bacterium]
MQKEQGISLVEVLVATSIILVALMALIGTFNLYVKIALGNAASAEAAYLAEEGVEAMKLIRDSSWSTNIAPLTVATDYFLTFQSSTWKATTTYALIDSRFERKIQLAAVNRDVSSNIAAVGTPDVNTRLVTVNVSWNDHGVTTTKSIATYITNFNND